MADGRHIENRFFVSRRHLDRLMRNLERKWRITCLYNSRWRTAAILKTALSPYLSCVLSDLDQIWYADADFHSEYGFLTQN